MEEIKNKKKLNKKPLLICLAIALVFAVIGFIDIKSNAAESVNSYGDNEVVVYLNSFRDVGGVIQQESDKKFVIKGNEDIEVYYYQSHTEPTKELSQASFYVVSNYPFEIIAYGRHDESYNYGQVYDYDITASLNNCGVYHWWDNNSYTNGQLLYYHTFVTDYSKVKQLEKTYNYEGFLEYYLKNELEVKVDYNSFKTDDDMPVPENIKRNIVVEDAWDSFTNTWYVDNSYEYLLWKNTSDLKIQIQTLPVVQYFEEKVGRVNFSQQFHGNTWNDSQILDVGVCNYTLQTDIDFIKENAESDYEFYRLCLDTKSLTLFEKSYFFYAYRLRYVDETNKVAGPWLCVYPNEILNGTNTFIIDSNGEITNSDSNMGEVVEKPLGESTLDETLKDIDNTLEFKDKYEIVDGDVDAQEATNWLYSVVNFIKGTPQVVGSVLAFLPQPILYGMYVCIFLGIIASGIAIVKALL